MNRPEQSLHKSVCEYFKLVLPAHVFWSSLDHAGGGQMVGRFRKIRGVKSGLPDIFMLFNGYAHFIELKAEGGRLSETQAECHAQIREAHGKIEICRSIDDVAETLAQWGIRTRDTRVQPKEAA